ncbi:MAG TPA: ABC transporter permease [Candidatus Acidoferrum sp.]|nr:ABC transporter permease [Candidatus Acidoferrum sp.]
MPGEWLTQARLRVKALLMRRKLERDLEDELQFHLAMRVEKNRASGLQADRAESAARRQFGNVSLVREDCREQWIFSWLEALWKDVRYAARILAKNPGFVAVVVFSLALGIGANTAVFSALNAVMLHALPYEHPETLATIWSTQRADPGSQDVSRVADVADWKKQNHVFADIAAISMPDRVTLVGLGEPGLIQVQAATPNFFDLVGARPALGRVFRAEEIQEQFQTVIISNSFWKDRFNCNPGVLGNTFRIEGVVSTVVGVMPAGFTGFAPWYSTSTYGKATDVWTPVDPERERNFKRSRYWAMPVARLKPGVTVAQAQAEMDVIARGMEQAYPQTSKGVGEKVIPLYDALHRGTKDKLYPLVGAAGFVLLIGCLNVANLMLSRTEGRRKEYSVRASLGAGRQRLMQQLLAECGLLTLLGGSLGVLLSFWGVRLLRLIAVGSPDAKSIGINGSVLLFATGLSVLTAMLFGLVPAIRASRANLGDALRDGESRTSTSRRGRARYLLVISEVAMAMVLLVGAGLMINSLLRVLLPSPGFEPANVLTMAVNLPGNEVKYVEKIPGKDMEKVSPKGTALHQQLLERAAALPGVESAGMISFIPPLGAGGRSFSILEHPIPSPENRPEAFINEVSPSYFRTMRISLKKGRYFDERDTENAPWAVVISETLASKYFPNEDPIGQQILLRYQPQDVDEERPRQIIGVAGEVKQIGMGGLHPLLYESFLQQPEVFWGGSELFHLYKSLVIRTTSDVRAHEADLTASVKQIVKEMDPDLPVTDVSTMDDVLGKFMSPSETYVIMLGVFGGIALVLAAIGVYGVLSYFVNQRTREMGIRFALGAQRGDVLALVGKLGLALAGTGLAIGVALALRLNQFMAEHFWLYNVRTTDPATYVAVGLLLVSIALIACYVPARRAANLDPMTILRHE